MEPAASASLQCPICGAATLPHAVVCASCGVHLDHWRANQDRYREHTAAQREAQRRSAEADAQVLVRRQFAQNRRWFARLSVGALALIGLAALLVAVGAAVWTRQQQAQAERLARHYAQAGECQARHDFACAVSQLETIVREAPDYRDARAQLEQVRVEMRRAELEAALRQAENCLAQADYACAIAGFEKVLAEAPDFPGAADGLQTARQQADEARLAAAYKAALECAAQQDYQCAIAGLTTILTEQPLFATARQQLADIRLSLAQQYLSAGRYQMALDELDRLLAEDPGNAQAQTLVNTVFERWGQQAEADGDWLTAQWVKLLRSLRAGSRAP